MLLRFISLARLELETHLDTLFTNQVHEDNKLFLWYYLLKKAVENKIFLS